MICQHCKERKANTHIKRNINGRVSELYLCYECAQELGVNDELKMPSIGDMFADAFLGNLLGSGVASMNSLAGVQRCGVCGASFDDIVNTGHLGCSECYNEFEQRLEPSITRLHGKAKHIGKYVTYTKTVNESDDIAPNQNEQVNELDNLKQQLKLAIKEQRFEDAAVLRDKINEAPEGNNE